MTSYYLSKAERIAKWIKDKDPDPITQTEVMQKFRIRKRHIFAIEKILMDNGAVVVNPYPNTNGRPGTHIHYSLGDGPVPEVEVMEPLRNGANMKLHPREKIVDAAEREIELVFRKHELTTGEFMMIVGQMLSRHAKYQIRWERHGDMEKAGGLEDG